MEKGAWIKDIKPGGQVSGIFLASDAQLAKTKNNRPYWRLRLADATGDMAAKIWQPLCDRISAIAEGAYVLASGAASLYNNSLQLSVTAFSELTPEERQQINPADFLKTGSQDAGTMFQSLREACEREFTHQPWRELALAILDHAQIQQDFLIAPAARTMHHNWAGGLLEHTLGVFNLCGHLASAYAQLDRQTLLAGALLHDIGKIRELSSGPSTVYTSEGELFGHIMLGLQIIEPFIAASGLEAPLADHLRHLILSHHGQLEYGSPVLPKTAEAIALHQADDLDARMAQFRQLLENTPANESISRQNILKRALFQMERTPAADSSIAMRAQIIQTGGEPPLEAYEEYDAPGEVPDDYDILREYWAEEAATTRAGTKSATKKAMKAEQCSLV